MKMTENARAIVLLLILIAIGGIVMYGDRTPIIRKSQVNHGTPR
jgi:hypothetical protein